MNSIDFLPEKYRNVQSVYHTRVWRVVLALTFGGIVLSAVVFQLVQFYRVQHELAQIRDKRDSAEAIRIQLKNLQKEAAELKKSAELVTYLRHPWPRSQLLARCTDRLTEGIQLTELAVSLENKANPTVAAKRQRPNLGGATVTVNVDELKVLRERFDHRQTVIEITGTTHNPTQIYVYLSRLDDDPLFEKTSLSSVASQQAALGTGNSFQIRLRVIPGYGQPGGPVKSPETGQLTQSRSGHTKATDGRKVSEYVATFNKAVFEIQNQDMVVNVNVQNKFLKNSFTYNSICELIQ